MCGLKHSPLRLAVPGAYMGTDRKVRSRKHQKITHVTSCTKARAVDGATLEKMRQKARNGGLEEGQFCVEDLIKTAELAPAPALQVPTDSSSPAPSRVAPVVTPASDSKLLAPQMGRNAKKAYDDKVCGLRAVLKKLLTIPSTFPTCPESTLLYVRVLFAACYLGYDTSPWENETVPEKVFSVLPTTPTAFFNCYYRGVSVIICLIPLINI